MSLAECRRCRLSLEDSLFDAAGGLEREAYRCEIDEGLPEQFREIFARALSKGRYL